MNSPDWLATAARWTILVAATLFPALGRADDPGARPGTTVLAASESPDAEVSPADCRPRLRDGDQFWQFSTRHLCGAATAELIDSIAVHQYECDGGEATWKQRSVDEFARSRQPQITVFYVHGNRTAPDTAVQQGWQLYDAVATTEAVPLRLAVWSWPSEQIRGPRRDVRSKAARAGDEAHYFGWVLRRLDAATPTGIVGYSLGAKITLGGLHLNAGGTLDGQTLDPPGPATQRFRVVLAAAAEHNHWIMPGHRHGLALDKVDHLFNLYNTCDPVLAQYWRIDRCERPAALGYAGIASESLGSYADRVTQRDAAPLIGRTHDEQRYLLHGMTSAELRGYLLPPPTVSQ